MTSHRFLIPVLVLAAVAWPAVAATTLYTDPTAFNNATTALYFPNSGIPNPISFTGSLVGGGAEYDDATTQAKFFAFRSDATTPDLFTLSGSALHTTIGLGDLVKITLPNNTYAFAANITVGSSFGNFCVEPFSTFNTSTNCGNSVVVPSSSDVKFFGVVSNAPFQTFWIGPSTSSPALVIDNFEVGVQAAQADAPEAATLLLIGSGLIGLRLLRRRQTRMAC